MTTSVQDTRDGRAVLQVEDRHALDASPRSIMHGFSAQIPLKNLSAGSYILHVGAQSSTGGYATERLVPFEVR